MCVNATSRVAIKELTLRSLLAEANLVKLYKDQIQISNFASFLAERGVKLPTEDILIKSLAEFDVTQILVFMLSQSSTLTPKGRYLSLVKKNSNVQEKMKSITSKFINEVENIFTLEYQFYEHQAQKKIAQIDDEIEDVKRNIKSIDLNQQVFLNIGGGVFITSAETLVRYSAGLLAQIAVEAKNQSTIRTFFYR